MTSFNEARCDNCGFSRRNLVFANAGEPSNKESIETFEHAKKEGHTIGLINKGIITSRLSYDAEGVFIFDNVFKKVSGKPL